VKLTLDQIGSFKLSVNCDPPDAQAGMKVLRVLYSAICRTDAKMWSVGHRDLQLPRVLGHEIVAIDDCTNLLYTIWPGNVCHECWYCRNGRENLCETIQIIGFHRDGGFANYIQVPESCLIVAPALDRQELLCFAEPIGCILHGLEFAGDLLGRKVIIYGGGIIGLLAGYICQFHGAQVTIVEKNAEKIEKSSAAVVSGGLSIQKVDHESDYDIALNCCDCHIAYSQCVLKLKKGGKLIFFSGMRKNENVETNILNLLHYQEIKAFGSYGLTKMDMVQSLKYIEEANNFLVELIESIIAPSEAEEVMENVLLGKSLKYIVNFGQPVTNGSRKTCLPENICSMESINHLTPELRKCLKKIHYQGNVLRSSAINKIDHKTKPLGALGKLEDLAVQLACLQNSLTPSITRKTMFVFAADHGVVEEGVSAYPAKVTEQMVLNFLNGGAAINCFCKQYDIDLQVVDIGINAEIADHPLLIKKKIGYGTANFTQKPAMDPAAAVLALNKGAEVIQEAYEQNTFEIVGIGEMGIGNTTSATAIISGVTGLGADDLTGRGTWVDNAGLDRKILVIQKSLSLHTPNPTDPLDLLSKVGGYEIAGMCGAILKAAELNIAIVLDGLISTAAGLLAYLFVPEIKHFFIAGHQSVEIAQKNALDFMGLDSLVDLNLRLGEGTGAAIAINLAELSCGIMDEMASFDEAGIESKLT